MSEREKMLLFHERYGGGPHTLKVEVLQPNIGPRSAAEIHAEWRTIEKHLSGYIPVSDRTFDTTATEVPKGANPR